MRIVLASLDYPPDATEGVARQRQLLAESLTTRGHEVHVVTLGARQESVLHQGVHVHRQFRGPQTNSFVASLPVLDRPLTDAQLLCEGVLALAERLPIDIIDVPLWLAQPFALVRHAPCPVVIWLQTTLLHLVRLQGRKPREHERVLAEIDRFALTHAAGCIADSSSVLTDVQELYDLRALASCTTIVHPGIAAASALPPRRRGAATVTALVVGRLEQRKGTALLFEAMPRLLHAVPNLRVRFVGRDNSGADGFRKQTGLTYPEAFAAHHPALLTRVDFAGYVNDAALSAEYEQADLLLHPALYESFGLIFLEAMRAGLPAVAFGCGGAAEVFAGGERDGAVLCTPGDVEGLVDSAATLARDPERRRRLGNAAREAFDRRFTSDRMAADTEAAYRRVLDATPAASVSARRRPRIFQVMEALQDRDAVSRIARSNAAILAGLGVERPVMALFSEASVRGETGRIRGARFRADDAAIVHYWGFSWLEPLIERLPGRLAVHYHNITPPDFFSPRTSLYEMTSRGYAQLDRLADRFDLIIGVSHYNVRMFSRHLSAPKPALCVYPQIDRRQLLTEVWDEGLAARLRTDGEGAHWLFVGRFARNKRQDQVMRAFDRFAALTGRGRLSLVGNLTSDPDFVAELTRLRATLPHGERIAFVPLVTDGELRAYYRAADLFVCASEHEGFCVPIAEAMAFGVPALALNRCAVGETVGEAGLLVEDWNDQQVAALAADLLESPAKRDAIVHAHQTRLSAFSPAAITERLSAVVHFLRDGHSSPLFTRAEPAPEASRRAS